MTLDIIASNTTTCGMIFHNKHTRFVLSPLVPQVGILPAEIGIERLNQQKGDLVNRTRGFCQQKMGWNPNQDGFSLDKVALVFLVMPPNWLQFILFFFIFWMPWLCWIEHAGTPEICKLYWGSPCGSPNASYRRTVFRQSYQPLAQHVQNWTWNPMKARSSK